MKNEIMRLADDYARETYPELITEARAALEAAVDKLVAENQKLRAALEKLARLGNGDYYGNSEGNVIARQALDRGETMTIEPNNNEVICPNCVTQFRAIPVNVQEELIALRAELESERKRIAGYELLTRSMEQRISYMTQTMDATKEAISTLQSEREANSSLTAELEAAKADAQRYLEKLIECRSSVKIAANEFDRFMLRKQPHANQCDIDEQKRLHELLDWIDAAMEAAK